MTCFLAYLTWFCRRNAFFDQNLKFFVTTSILKEWPLLTKSWSSVPIFLRKRKFILSLNIKSRVHPFVSCLIDIFSTLLWRCNKNCHQFNSIFGVFSLKSYFFDWKLKYIPYKPMIFWKTIYFCLTCPKNRLLAHCMGEIWILTSNVTKLCVETWNVS